MSQSVTAESWAVPPDVHRKPLLYADAVFGAYCLLIAGTAAVAWTRGIGTARSVAVFLLFSLANSAISTWSRRSQRPFRVEVARAVIGSVLAPFAYIFSALPLGMWWPAFLIMCTGGTVILSLITRSAVQGRLLSGYYVLLYFVTERLFTANPNWHVFVVNAGTIAMIGLFTSEMVALLGRSLSAERQHRHALEVEKTRSESALQAEAAAALRASEEHFRTLIEHSSDGIAIVGPDTRFLYLSPAARRILDAGPGTSFRPIVHSDDRARVEEEFRTLLSEAAGVRRIEMRVVRRDGTCRLLESVARRLPDGTIVSNVRDVTDRWDMARALRAIVEGTASATGDEFFRSLVMHMASALGVQHAFVAVMAGDTADRVRTVAFWSEGAIVPNIEYALPGTPCERVVSGEFCHYPSGVQQRFPEDRDLVMLDAQSYMGMPLTNATGEVLGHLAVVDTRPMHEDEQRDAILRIFAARAGAELERQAADRAVRLLNEQLEARVAERTAELQAANRQLAIQVEQRERLTAILEATTDLVATATLDGQVTYMNRAGRRLLGFDDGDVGTVRFAEVYTKESLDIFEREGFPTALREGSWSGEAVLRSRDGRRIPVSLVGNIHRGPDGVPASLSAIGRDITERKRFEADLQAAKERAESASRAKSAFLATMSHEIRTPMNAVIGMTGLLLNTPLSPRQREYAETIRSSGEALIDVINDILDFSKIEAGMLGLEQRPFDLRACVESALDLLAPRAAEKGIEVAYLLDRSVPEGVVGDATRVRQILVNLLGNAIKFTEQGEVVVCVGARPASGETAGRGERQSEPLVELHVAVRDTGIGIPADKRGRLFQSFSQLDASTTRQYGGTGLGLAISKRLAELMSGTMWVESEGIPGRGSTFHFTILAGTTSLPVSRGWSTPLPALRGRRVLIVDDNATNRRIVGAQVRDWGMLSVEARTPDEALRIVEADAFFDVAILDMHMPGMDGLTLARTLCARRSAKRLPLVMLTSLGREIGGDPEAIPCFAGYLTKPVKPSQLHDALVTAIAGGEALSGPSRETPTPPIDDQLASRLPLRILLAEDLQVNQRLALLTLEALGYDAAVANNGQQAFDALARAAFDVVLMDVQMPVLDGLEATRRIRRNLPEDRQPYIIAMTANAMQGDREACLAAGMDDYVSKPVFEAQLRAALERAGTAIPAGARDAAHRAEALAEPADPRMPVIDDTVLARILQRPGSGDVIALFLDEVGRAMQDVRAAFDASDSEAVREAAHRIKGSSGYLGAARLAASSGELEQLARLGRLVDAVGVAAAMEHDFQRVRGWLASPSS
jgi:PAS domain S-box-containing protein